MVTYEYPDFPGSFQEFMQSVEREILWIALQAARLNHTEAARQLGLTFRAFRYKAESLGIKPDTGSGIKAARGRKPLGPHWPKLRMDALRMYGNRCQCCGSGPEQGAVIHVDHVKPRHLYPHLEFRLDNLQVLCSACHESKGAISETDWR